MKIIISLIVSFLLCMLSSCGSSSDELKDFAEQSMGAISRGDDTSVRLDNALVLNKIAKSALDSVNCPDNLVETYFQLGEPFSRWELIEVNDTTIDLYSLKDLTVGESGVNGKYEGVMYQAYLDIYKHEGGEYNNSKLIKINERMDIILEYTIPLYNLRYKVDEYHEAYVGNKYRIATLGVIKHSEHGYKVVSFMWEN